MENVLIYGSIFDITEDMTNEEIGLLFKGINSWRKGEEVIFEDRYLKGIWMGIKPNLDKLKDSYDKKVSANQANGNKGGRPKKNTTPTKEVPNSVSNEVSQPVEVISSEVKEDVVEMIKPSTNKSKGKKVVSKLILNDVVKYNFDNDNINTGQSVDLYNSIENDKFLYVEDLEVIINEYIMENEIAKQFN